MFHRDVPVVLIDFSEVRILDPQNAFAKKILEAFETGPGLRPHLENVGQV
jgi:hypothetical protein